MEMISSVSPKMLCDMSVWINVKKCYVSKRNIYIYLEVVNKIWELFAVSYVNLYVGMIGLWKI